MAQFWGKNRLTRLAAGCAIALSLAAAATLVFNRSDSSMLARGDFPGFYSAAVTGARGDWEKLYDVEYQRAIQNEAWPSLGGRFYISAYPPFVATILTPLGMLDRESAQVVFTLIQLAAFLGAIVLGRKISPVLESLPFVCGVYLFALFPNLAGILAAQNTGTSLFLLTAAIVGLNQKNSRGSLIAGVCLGLWLYKPQYALLAIVLGTIIGGVPTALGAIVSISFLYLLGVVALGWNWIPVWLEAAQKFTALNLHTNGLQMISLPSTIEYISLVNFGVPPIVSGTSVAAICGIAAMAVIALRRQNHAALMIGPFVALSAPQALFYDLGIAILPAFFAIKALSDRTVWSLLGFQVLLIVLCMTRESFPVPLFVVVTIGCLYWVRRSSDRL